MKKVANNSLLMIYSYCLRKFVYSEKKRQNPASFFFASNGIEKKNYRSKTHKNHWRYR